MNADEIVRKLANQYPWDLFREYHQDSRGCGICGAIRTNPRGTFAEFIHADDCLWVEANRYVANAPVASQDVQDSPIVARVGELLSTPEDGTFWCKSERYPTFESYLAAGRPKRQ